MCDRVPYISMALPNGFNVVKALLPHLPDDFRYFGVWFPRVLGNYTGVMVLSEQDESYGQVVSIGSPNKDWHLARFDSPFRGRGIRAGA